MDFETKSLIRTYIQDDVEALMRAINKPLKEAGHTKLSAPRPDTDYGEDYCDVGFTIESKEGPVNFEVHLTYAVDGEDIYLDTTINEYGVEIAEYFIDEYNELGITASTKTGNKRRIVAADEDFDDLGDETGGEDDFEEDVDDLAENVGDMQDWLENVEEDDTDIDVDANIADHYIVQCDGCHDVFISALVESDQIVEKISGICPCCEKETDQYIKFIIRDVEFEEDQFDDTEDYLPEIDEGAPTV